MIISGLRRFRGDPFRCDLCGKPAVPPCKYCFECRDKLNQQIAAERRKKSQEPKLLYAISVKGDPSATIKFGYAAMLQSRFKTLQIGSPVLLEILASCPGRPHHEKMIHRRLIRHKSHGEWFRRAPETLEIVQKIADGTILEFLTMTPAKQRIIKHLQVATANSITSAEAG